MLWWFLSFSNVNQSELYIYISPSFESLFPLHSNSLGCHRVPGWAPCVTWQLPASYLIYIYIYIYMLLSQFPLASTSLAVSTVPFSMSSSPFLLCKQINQYCFSRFHMHALIQDIWFSLSDLLHSVLQTLDSSTSQQLTETCSFL